MHPKKNRDQNSPRGILDTELGGTKFKANTASFDANSPYRNVLEETISALNNGL